jgi:hypothetical protein
MPTDPTEETGLTLVLLVMAGLPKHPIYLSNTSQTPHPASTNSRNRTPKRFSQNGK